MTKLRRLALLVVAAHWMVAIWHLFMAAKVVPAPNNSVSGLGITFITLGHLLMCIVLWRLRDRLSGLILLLFFLAAGTADTYEHFVHAAPNNVFRVSGNWTVPFDVSVFGLLALEILGCLLGIVLLGGWFSRNRQSRLADHGLAS
jgi:hypothetical protein